ncbi:MAG: RNA polymerase sigma factor RpoD [Acholeplasmatales bacterium]|nr:RNA polymerase sigma factor RpoD [Acholeplasmatales bacterium]
MDLKPELKDLFNSSKEKGYTSESEVRNILSDEENETLFDEVFNYFKDNGIDIISDDEYVDFNGEEAEEMDMPKDYEDNEKLMSFDDIEKQIKTDDPVKMYLMEIGKFPLLTAKEEKDLALKVAKANKAKELLANDDSLTDIEKEKLNKDISNGEFAKEKLINSNLKLVVSIAKNYEGKGMQFLDLIQEGSMGLMKAVEKFVPEMGNKFSTYATWWIRQAITRAVADQGRTIRIPVHMVETINKLLREQRRLVQELSRDPSVEELAEALNITSEKVQMILKTAQEPISLEKPVGEEDDSSLGDFVADPNGLDPYEYTSNEMLKRELEDILNELQERERKVIKLRFGLEDGRCHTLEEVGLEFGITRERIRQIESKAIKKLKQPSRSKRLLGFIGKDED